MTESLTEREYWNRHWDSLVLPVAHNLENSTGLARDILEFFESVLASRPPKTVLEIGGAPGGYLSYFHHRFGSEVHSLDYSETGCKKTEENFRMLGCPITVHHKDVFAIGADFPRFDLVYSLGLIEHFADTAKVVRAHRHLMKPDGLLILGVPHFVRVFWPVLLLLAPHVTRGHNRSALSPDFWRTFEREVGIVSLGKAYVGGFNPWLMGSVIGEELGTGGGRFKAIGRSLMLALRVTLALRRRVESVLPGIGRVFMYNGRRTSSYAMGVYAATHDDCGNSA
jgi:2-polyprenyl-6-hydroxyphenyl methylase/3-demethylubiquinone-9 3-methyltransferase